MFSFFNFWRKFIGDEALIYISWAYFVHEKQDISFIIWKKELLFFVDIIGSDWFEENFESLSHNKIKPIVGLKLGSTRF